ncbi:MAG: amidase [Burkholderiales bacterium]|nr:amidase [Burkholderiales bacterium]
MTELSRLGAREAANLIAEGGLGVAELVEACLARIEAREPQVRAWTYLDAETARAQARDCDAKGPRPPLYGVPIGIKDIIDTADMPTAYGSPIYADHRPAADADCVARIRAAGGIVLGKTVTTEFAFRHPNGQTRNPHDPGHTPGGSSSGSAAAVADFMVPLALGTQTGGSIIRPASYCGVYGYKPTFDTFGIRGVRALAPGLDTLGHFARNVDDLALLASVLSTRLPADVPPWRGAPPRVGLAPMPDWSSAEAETVNAVRSAAARLEAEGARVAELTPPERFRQLGAAHKTIMHAEALRELAFEFERHAEGLSAELMEILQRAAAIPAASYLDALALAQACRGEVEVLFAGNDVLLAPSATGAAPAGLGHTGDPVFNAVWTLLHLPCLTIPYAQGPRGLPVGVQLIGRPRRDVQLLSAAKWIAARLDLRPAA